MNISSEVLLTQIRNQISIYQLNVKSDNQAHRFNINERAETFTIPLFKMIFGWDELSNLNQEQMNYPGIDLGDHKNKVAVQVTSQTSLKKIKHTLTLFIEKNYQEDFNRLILFLLREKQDSYSQSAIDKICGDEFEFDVKKDIIDLTDLMQFIKELQVEDLKKILKLFQDEMGIIRNKTVHQNLDTGDTKFSASTTPPFETGLLNLIEIGFPTEIFLADWNFTKKDLKTRKRNDRKLVKEALAQNGLKFSVDWVTIEKQIIAFHNLRDVTIPISQIVDQGTVTSLGTKEFYENPFYRNKFVELLQRCLQQKLYKLDINWQYQEGEYIFVPLSEKDKNRKIEWSDRKTNKRTVYKQIPKYNDKSKVYCHEHFAFKTQFFLFGSNWYLAITPDWFYSYDGYHRAEYAIEEKRNYKKRVEANHNVSTHVRFISSFISQNNPQEMYQKQLFSDRANSYYPYEHLWVKDLIKTDHMPRLPDQDWIPASAEDSDTSKKLL